MDDSAIAIGIRDRFYVENFIRNRMCVWMVDSYTQINSANRGCHLSGSGWQHSENERGKERVREG